jgi:ABC-type amino acid transport substrate-binding protein
LKDAFIIDTPVAYEYAKTSSNHLKVAFIIQTNERYGICIPQNQVNFRNALNKVIEDMKADGSLQALLHKYNAA